MIRLQPHPIRTYEFWITLGWLMLLTGCATPFGTTQQDFQLLPPGSLEQPATVLLKIDSSQENVSHHWEAVLNVNAERIYLIILGPLGQRLATLNFDGQHLMVDHGGTIPIDISLKKLLWKLQMIFWPLTALNTDKWNKDWRFEEQKGIRYVYYQQQRVAEIHHHSSSPWSGKFDYTSKMSDYRLSIQSSQLDQ